MDRLDQLHSKVRIYLLVLVIIQTGIAVGVFYLLTSQTKLSAALCLLISLGLSTLVALVTVGLLTNLLLQPLKAIWQTIVHLSPEEHGGSTPTFNDLKLG
ncbi:MAG: hypothetical protein AAB971_03170, partial [Patescibacteria group bacterium]